MGDLQDQTGNDEYLFDLDHFVSMAREPASDVDPSKLPRMPHSSDGQDVHLVLDARLQGVCFCWPLILLASHVFAPCTALPLVCSTHSKDASAAVADFNLALET